MIKQQDDPLIKANNQPTIDNMSNQQIAGEQPSFEEGIAIFQIVNKLDGQTYFTNTVRNILSNQSWEIYNLDYEKHSWTKIFQFMTSSNAKKLSLKGNQKPNILKDLTFPNEKTTSINRLKFNCLTTLILEGNYITSIQFLPFLNAERLQTLNIRDNYISNFKPFSKFNLKSLNHISLQQNKTITTQNSINRSNFCKQSALNLIIEATIYDTICEQDLSKIAKLCVKNIKKIQIKNQKRINQVKVIKMAKNSIYLKMKFFTSFHLKQGREEEIHFIGNWEDQQMMRFQN